MTVPVRAGAGGRAVESVPMGLLLGVGVSDCRDGTCGRLDNALPDVEGFARLLGEDFTCEILSEPAESEVRGRLQALPESVPGGPLVVLWCGHGLGSAADSLRLLARDSAARSSSGLGVSDVVAPCAESGASQLLFVFDTCFSGAAIPAGDVAARIMRSAPPRGGPPRVFRTAELMLFHAASCLFRYSS